MTEQQQTYPIAEAVRQAYRQGEEDEAMEPRVLVGHGEAPVGRIGDGDYVIFYDIRGEREIELTEAFTDPEFSHVPPFPASADHHALGHDDPVQGGPGREGGVPAA